MQPLTSSQAKHLRGLAHGLKPVVFVGHKGLTPAVLDSVREALDAAGLPAKLPYWNITDWCPWWPRPNTIKALGRAFSPRPARARLCLDRGR